MARNDDSKLRYDRRGMLWRMGASGIAVAVPACGGDKDEPGTDNPPLDPGASNSSTASAAPTPGPTPSATPSSPATTSPGASTSPPATTMEQTSPPASTTQPPAQMTSAPSASDTAPDPTTDDSTDPPPEDTAPQGTGGAGEEPDPEMGGGGSGGEGNPPAMNGELEVPPWDDVPMCTASRTDGAGQGPFFIHNEEIADDIDLFRQDIRGKYNEDAEDGIEMQLHLRILDATSTDCAGTPLADVEVYIWHTDGQGYYSGFGTRGTDNEQRPDTPYSTRPVPGQNDLDNLDRFCRGTQVTDANGVVSFKSFFPGWYNGRDVHIHLVCLSPGTTSRGRTTYSGDGHLFTTQFYFEPALTDMVHKSAEPYKRRTEGDLAEYYEGAIQADEGGNSGLRAKASFANNIVVAQMQILIDPAGTTGGGGGGFGGF